MLNNTSICASFMSKFIYYEVFWYHQQNNSLNLIWPSWLSGYSVLERAHQIRQQASFEWWEKSHTICAKGKLSHLNCSKTRRIKAPGFENFSNQQIADSFTKLLKSVRKYRSLKLEILPVLLIPSRSKTITIYMWLCNVIIYLTSLWLGILKISQTDTFYITVIQHVQVGLELG